MYLVWYIIVCGRNGEGYDSSAKIRILHVQELVSYPSPFLPYTITYQPRYIYSMCRSWYDNPHHGGMVRAKIAAPAHGVYVSWLVRYCVWEEW
jgi:hypothetical protein